MGINHPHYSVPSLEVMKLIVVIFQSTPIGETKT